MHMCPPCRRAAQTQYSNPQCRMRSACRTPCPHYNVSSNCANIVYNPNHGAAPWRHYSYNSEQCYTGYPPQLPVCPMPTCERRSRSCQQHIPSYGRCTSDLNTNEMFQPPREISRSPINERSHKSAPICQRRTEKTPLLAQSKSDEPTQKRISLDPEAIVSRAETVAGSIPTKKRISIDPEATVGRPETVAGSIPTKKRISIDPEAIVSRTETVAGSIPPLRKKIEERHPKKLTTPQGKKYPNIDNGLDSTDPTLARGGKYPGIIENDRGTTDPRVTQREKYPGIDNDRGTEDPRVAQGENYPGIDNDRGTTDRYTAMTGAYSNLSKEPQQQRGNGFNYRDDEIAAGRQERVTQNFDKTKEFGYCNEKELQNAKEHFERTQEFGYRYSDDYKEKRAADLALKKQFALRYCEMMDRKKQQRVTQHNNAQCSNYAYESNAQPYGYQGVCRQMQHATPMMPEFKSCPCMMDTYLLLVACCNRCHMPRRPPVFYSPLPVPKPTV